MAVIKAKGLEEKDQKAAWGAFKTRLEAEGVSGLPEFSAAQESLRNGVLEQELRRVISTTAAPKLSSVAGLSMPTDGAEIKKRIEQFNYLEERKDSAKILRRN